jgi:hypothetical protein
MNDFKPGKALGAFLLLLAFWLGLIFLVSLFESPPTSVDTRPPEKIATCYWNYQIQDEVCEYD